MLINVLFLNINYFQTTSYQAPLRCKCFPLLYEDCEAILLPSGPPCCLLCYRGHEDNRTVPALISLTISKSCQVSFRKVAAAHELWAEYSYLENHLQPHLQGTQGFTVISK